MTGRIITARHGRPDLSREVHLSSKEYGDWWRRYDEVSLHPDERPPESLIEIAKAAKTVLSSTLPRAIDTANQATMGSREIPTDVIYVEAPLPAPPLPFLKLRPGTWGVIARTFWFLGYAPRDTEHHLQTWGRVKKITAQLGRHASEGDVLLCAHGYINWMIDRRLLKEGWTMSEREGGNRYWSWRIYEPPVTGEGTKASAAVETI